MVKVNAVTEMVEKQIVLSKNYYCDVCKNIFATDSKRGDGSYRRRVSANNPYMIKMVHNDYADSHDDTIVKHVCSDNCLASVFLEFVEDFSKEYDTARLEVSNFD